MSEQTIQDSLYTEPVRFGGGFECVSVGATTVNDLISSNIIEKVNVSKRAGNKKPDVLIVNETTRQIIVYQEHKAPKHFRNESDVQKAIKQELFVAQELGAKIYIATDGDRFIWINPFTGNRVIDEAGNNLEVKITPKENGDALAKLIPKVILSISKDNDQILSKEELDPTDLAMKVSKILVNMSFASAKTCLYTFVELFLFKYLSDIGILYGTNAFSHIMGLYSAKSDNQKRLYNDAHVLNEYLTGPRTIMKILFPEDPVDQTSIINGMTFHADKSNETGLYESPAGQDVTFRLIMEAFQEYENEHGKFIDISRDFKSKLFETFMKNSNEKSGMGQFFTPLKIVSSMVDMVEIKPGMVICDPACGVGKFLLEAVEDHLDDYYEIKDGKLYKKVTLVGYEKIMEDDITVILAKANTLIYFSQLFKDNPDYVQQLAQELLNGTYTAFSSVLGTLDQDEAEKYDLILANPPYFQSAAIMREAEGTGLYNNRGYGVESLFVEWIVRSLKPNGVANIVIPDGILSNTPNAKLKEYIRAECMIESIISLPNNAFFNTPKKTYILTLRKKTKSEKDRNEQQSYPVFAYICSSIGETLDTYRFDIDDNDLKHAVEKYRVYCSLSDKNDVNDESSVLSQVIRNDKRFKAIPIEDMKSDTSWIIENWWNDEEQIELGLQKRDTTMTPHELIAFIDGLMEDLSEYKEVLSNDDRD